MIIMSCFASQAYQKNGVIHKESPVDFYDKQDLQAYWDIVVQYAKPDEEIRYSGQIPDIKDRSHDARLVILGPSCCPWQEIRNWSTSTPTPNPVLVIQILPEDIPQAQRYTAQQYAGQGALVVRTPQELLDVLMPLSDEDITEAVESIKRTLTNQTTRRSQTTENVAPRRDTLDLAAGASANDAEEAHTA